MAKAETLAEVKRIEDDVRKARAAAQAEAQRILKDARARADDILARGGEDADRAYKAAIDRARTSVATERAAIVKAGEKEADTVRDAATGARLEQASAAVVKRFQDAVRGPR